MPGIQLNCTHAPMHTKSDVAVAGVGVLISFVFTALLSLVLSAWIIIQEWRGASSQTTTSKIIRKLLSSFSDQQILKGIGLQAVTLAWLDTMVPYHFFIVWMLTSVSTATHSIALLALHEDFKKDWVLRWLRQFLMFVNLMLSCVLSIFLFLDITKQISPTLPMLCILRDDTAITPRSHHDHTTITPRSHSDLRVSQAGTIGVIVGQCLVFVMAVLWLHSARNRWYHPLRALSYSVLTAVGIGGTVRVLQLSQLVGTLSVLLADFGEAILNFGQVIALVLLFSPFISTLQMYRNLKNAPFIVMDSEGEMFELAPKPEFQPNPFFHTSQIAKQMEEV